MQMEIYWLDESPNNCLNPKQEEKKRNRISFMLIITQICHTSLPWGESIKSKNQVNVSFLISRLQMATKNQSKKL